MKRDEAAALGISIVSDLQDIIPQIFPLSIIGDLIDAATIQVNRTVFKEIPKATLPGLGEFVPIVGDILPGHTAGALLGLSERYGSLKAAGVLPAAPKVTIPDLPKLKAIELPTIRVKA